MLTTLFLSFLAVVGASPTPSSYIHAIPISKRESNVVHNGEVNTTALRSQILQVQSKYSRNFALYEKNTGERHPLANGSVHSQTSDLDKRISITEIIGFDGQSYAQVAYVGSQAQSVVLMLDTGSSDMIIPATGCTTCVPHSANLYNPRASLTSRATGSTFSVNFGTASSLSTVSGSIYRDKVVFAQMTVPQQLFGAATYESDVNKGSWNGMMGLAFPSLTAFGSLGTSPFVSNIVATNTLDKNRFGFSYQDPQPYMFFGNNPSNFYTGSIHWTKVIKPLAFWQIPLTAIEYKTTEVVKGVSAIIDTGTTLIYGDKKNVEAIYAQVKGSKDASATVGPGFYTFPCASNITLDFVFGTAKFPLLSQFTGFMQGRVPGSQTECIGAIAYHGDPYWIIGLQFLQHVYSAFDLDGHQVGFAPLI